MRFGQIIVVQGFKKLPKVPKIAQSGHTATLDGKTGMAARHVYYVCWWWSILLSNWVGHKERLKEHAIMKTVCYWNIAFGQNSFITLAASLAIMEIS